MTGTDIDLAALRQLAKERLSKKRFRHVLAVEKMAVDLARTHGADIWRCQAAALLHDLMKESPLPELLHWCRGFAIIEHIRLPYQQKVVCTRALLHGPAASAYAQKELGIADREILDAVYYHTTGRPAMTGAEKVVFLADMVGLDRDFHGVDKLRKLCFASLNRGMAAALSNNILYLAKEQKPIYEETVSAYNSYKLLGDD